MPAKHLQVDWTGIDDPTGFLHSFAKSLYAAALHSPYADRAEDVIAASGFAFRMWIDAGQFCPSAMSTWDFERQKPWTENAGLACANAGRYWEQDEFEAERRTQAVELIRQSIDRGAPAVAWDCLLYTSRCV